MPGLVKEWTENEEYILARRRYDSALTVHLSAEARLRSAMNEEARTGRSLRAREAELIAALHEARRP